MSIQSELPARIENDPDPFLGLENGGTEIYWIRHADAFPGPEELEEGGYDNQPLSRIGHRQAQALARHLQKCEFAAIYSSPVRRAHQTATYIGDALALPIAVEEGLREVILPPLPTGPELLSAHARASAIRTHIHNLEAMVFRVGSWSQVPGCECSLDLRTRLLQTVQRIVAQAAGQRVALVTHSGIINAHLATLLGMERDYFFSAANTSVSVLRMKGERHLLLRLNDTTHLAAEYGAHLREEREAL